jgi:hypothetical protein
LPLGDHVGDPWAKAKANIAKTPMSLARPKVKAKTDQIMNPVNLAVPQPSMAAHLTSSRIQIKQVPVNMLVRGAKASTKVKAKPKNTQQLVPGRSKQDNRKAKSVTTCSTCPTCYNPACNPYKMQASTPNTHKFKEPPGPPPGLFDMRTYKCLICEPEIAALAAIQ